MPNENEKPQKKHALDKILMGAVIGGAIGSVLGAAIAPKKGKETRREIGEAVKSGAKGSKKFFQKIKDFFSFKRATKSHEPDAHPVEPASPAGLPASAQKTTHSSVRKIPTEAASETEKHP